MIQRPLNRIAMPILNEVNATRREYRLTAFQKSVKLVFALGLLVAACSFFHLAENPIGRDFALIVGTSFLVPGLIQALSALRSQLVLDGTRIEVRSALCTFTVDRNEIQGLRRMKNNYGSWIRLYLRENRGALNVSSSFTGADELTEWLQGIPDLDQQDAAEIIQQISDQDSPTATGNIRPNPLKRAKAWAIYLSVIAGVFGILIMFVNDAPLGELLLVVVALLPPLAALLIHRHPLWFTIFKRKTDPRADLGLVVFFPALGLLMSLQRGPAHLVDAFQLTYWALLVLVCLLAALFRSVWENPSRWGVLAFMLLIGGFYSSGLVSAADIVPDRSTSQPYRTEVLRKYETHGKSAGFYLRLAPWGPLAYSDDVRVFAGVYQQTRAGDRICLQMHSGFLHAPWFTLAPCLDHPSTPTPLNE